MPPYQSYMILMQILEFYSLTTLVKWGPGHKSHTLITEPHRWGLFNQKHLQMTAFLIISPLPNKPWYLGVCSTSLLKTLWEKEKLLVMSNLYFSHSVFYPFGELSAIFINLKVICNLIQCGRVQNLSFWKVLIR